MVTYEDALRLDVAQKWIEAVDAYEEVIKQPDAPIDSFINLACIYWDSQDYGSTHLRKFWEIGYEKMYAILDQCYQKFGFVPEVEFWRLYFAWIVIGDDFPVEKAIELVQHPDCNLVPYFYIYIHTKDPIYLPQVKALIEIARLQPTVKNKYILSMVDRDD